MSLLLPVPSFVQSYQPMKVYSVEFLPIRHLFVTLVLTRQVPCMWDACRLWDAEAVQPAHKQKGAVALCPAGACTILCLDS